MGLFSFLFGKKKEKQEKTELKKISTFEIVENTNDSKKVEEKAEYKAAAETVEAIKEEKKGEISDTKIVTNIEESPKKEAIAEKNENEKLKKPAPIEIGETTASSKPAPKKVEKSCDGCVEETKEEESVMADESAAPEVGNGRVGKFEIKKTKDGRFVFNLYASNHVIVATSQIYSSSQSAMIGIKSIISNAEKAPVEDTTLKSFEPLSYPKWEIYLDKSEHYRFRLYASNGSCVVHSQGYTSKANCKKGIESIMKCAPTAEIDKSYLKKAQE